MFYGTVLTGDLELTATQSYEWHFYRWFHRLATLVIHHPFTLSFQA